MNTSRRKSTGGATRQPGKGTAVRRARRAPTIAATWPDLPREDEHPQPYRPELVARLERAVREGRYRPDPQAIAAAMIDRMDAFLD